MKRICLFLSIALLACVSCQEKIDPIEKIQKEKEDLPEGYYASGKITYNDGKPAEGVSVSDGFNVSVTDASGEYKLDTSEDTKYIYFSYPSDAVITRAGTTGLPYFFTKYSADKHSYDFSLTRGTVEKEFALFALADPQAHYAVRGNQKVADTDRFANEAVPAINSQIKAMQAKGIPCYAVTLGDIVYSEGSRDSNPGMTIMRGHFKSIDAPVFQTMGNHDFTFITDGGPIGTDANSTSVNLKAQSVFEETFGPVNYSFNRGDVHVVCMKNVFYTSTTRWDGSSYKCGFTDGQYEWLKKDLANVPKSKKVILCIHIPIDALYDNPNVTNVVNLIKEYTDPTIFSGHTHYHHGIVNVHKTTMVEHVHSAVCGHWWWSNINGDGCPNGYSIYTLNGTDIKDEFYIGFNEKMNTRDYQMRMYKGGLTYGGSHGYFKSPFEEKDLLINVFNGDPRWKVKVYEDGKYTADATHMASNRQTFSSVSAGETKLIASTSNQDWWAIGYVIGVCGRGTSGTSYFTNMFHMWKYTLNNPSAKVHVEATDPYGNTYSCDEVVTNGTDYPAYIMAPNN